MTVIIRMSVEIEGVSDIDADDLSDAVKSMKGVLDECYDHYRTVRVAIEGMRVVE